jgi:hypothetical protein
MHAFQKGLSVLRLILQKEGTKKNKQRMGFTTATTNKLDQSEEIRAKYLQE